MRQASVGFHCPDCTKTGGQKIFTPASLRVEPLVVKTLIAVNAVVFLAVMVLDGVEGSINLQGEGMLFGPAVAAGEWWRIVTSGFLHAGLIHVGFNMVLLWQLGSRMEETLGHVRFALLYAVGLLGGSLLVLIISPNQFTLGASGAVFGLMGATMVNQLARNVNPMETGIGGLVAINLAFTFFFPGISIGGHLGGLAAGAAAGAVISYGPKLIPDAAIPVILGGLVLVAAVAGVMVVS